MSTRQTVATLVALAAAATLSACGPTPATTPAGSLTQTATMPPTSTSPTMTPSASHTVVPTMSAPDPVAPDTPTATPTATPTSVAPSQPVPVARVLWQRGDSGSKVRDLQARLRQIDWYSGDVVDSFGPKTQAAVEGFQAKRGYPVTGKVDEVTYAKLVSMTRQPTRDELNNVKPVPAQPAQTSLDLDPRCLTGRVMCVSKTTRQLTWMIDGEVQFTLAARFGPAHEPTREGVFPVSWKKVDVTSTIYHTKMPYSMFFSGGQAVHYSASFAMNGYNGNSHGCINIRSRSGIERLYSEVNVGDLVIVHW